ncbi:hypothetical protein DRO32_00770 [Candidatus Bathyarchaeota archaeon]|nr:MAG: hypothetical protein DRO32_00770 [Candidatus Bathyarchaeota archaeon]
MEEILVFLGVLMGCLARSLVPFMRKLGALAREGRSLSWDHRYTASLAVSLFVGFVASMTVFQAVPAGLGGGITAFCCSFVIGFGSNSITNELMKLVGVV